MARMARKRTPMKKQARVTLKMARWMAREYAQYSPAERGRKIRRALGNSASARSFVRRLMPQFYNDAYGEASTLGAFGYSVSARSVRLRAKSR